MKTKFFLSIITLMIFCSWTVPTKSEFLFLNSDQLKPLGLEQNEHGVFYKNFNPNWKEDNARYACLSFYSGNDNYLTSHYYKESEVVDAKGKNEKILMKMETTRNDFYPVLIGDTKGDQSLDSYIRSQDVKLFPVAICLSEAEKSKRNDTIVVWFKFTEALKKVLPENIKFDDYLQVPPKVN